MSEPARAGLQAGRSRAGSLVLLHQQEAAAVLLAVAAAGSWLCLSVRAKKPHLAGLLGLMPNSLAQNSEWPPNVFQSLMDG